MKTIGTFIVLAAICAALTVFASSGKIPAEAKAVAPFDQSKYLGNWYEIARLDYKWEKNLDNVTACYALNENGTIRVENRGYNFKKDKWEKSIGKAKPAEDPNVGELKVSFFGPFYAGYNVIAIDKDYKYALVAGESTDYLWILSREKTIPAAIREKYLKLAQEVGYNTEALVWVKHDKD